MMKRILAMKVRFMFWILLLLIVGCSNGKEQYSSLSTQEQEKLTNYQLNHEFISGCVTEKLHEINRDYCDQESNYCNIPPESFFDYQQWMKVYTACLVEF